MKPQKQTKENEVFAALDAGSSKVLCLVARPGNEPGSLRILGIGQAESVGLEKGCVTNVQEAVASIQRAVRDAQYTADLQISGVWASIGGGSLVSANCTGQTVLRGSEVRTVDVDQVAENARQSALRAAPPGRDLIKLIEQGYKCGDVVTDDPKSLMGPKLECHVHALYGSALAAKNLKRCIQRVGLELLNYEPHPWAAAMAALSETERICDSVLIDIGAETTSLIVFSENRVQFTDVRPWGAELLTRDLAMVLGIGLDDAERLKCAVGECRPSEVLPHEVVQVEQKGGVSRPYLRELVVKTLSARVRQFFGIYRKLLADAGALEHVELVVLTGGGAMLPGIADEAAEVLGRRVRIGIPREVEGETHVTGRPDAVVAAGLIKCALTESAKGDERAYGVRRGAGFFGRVKTFFIGDY